MLVTCRYCETCRMLPQVPWLRMRSRRLWVVNDAQTLCFHGPAAPLETPCSLRGPLWSFWSARWLSC